MVGTKAVMDTFKQHVMPNYIRYPIVFEKGKGSYLWDTEGNRYLDFFAGWATTGLGHSHPQVVLAIQEQAAKIIHIPNIYYTVPQGELAELIAKHSFPGKTFFCNSGAEANESAIKLARKYGSSSERYEIVSLSNSFHGRTLATVTATAQEKYHQGFAPLPAGFTYAEFNNFEKLQNVIGEKTIGIILELIQGEGGINVASHEYVKNLRKLCDEKNIVLIFDEVQTGIGRTGEYFAFQHYSVEPDVMTLAKSLGNGTAIGAMVMKEAFSEILSPGSHASTFGGNPLACSAGAAVFQAIDEEKILENVKNQGAYLKQKLETLQKKYQKLIKEVRGFGLMLGLELNLADGSQIIKQCMEKKVLFNCTHQNVIRFMPMLNVTKKEVDEAVSVFEEVIANLG